MTGVDLAQIITINEAVVEIYQQGTEPTCGKKLNKAALIKLLCVKPKNHQSAKAKEKQLKAKIESAGGEHISYDMTTFAWEFKIPGA